MAVSFILLLAAVLRLWGIGFGLPHLYHADEPVIVNHALYFGSGDLNPHFFNIPPLASYLLFGIYGLLFISGKILGVWQTAADYAGHFFQDPSLFYLTGRIALGVIPAVVSVAVFMRWFRTAGFSRAWVGLAGATLAVCFLHVSDAHYIYTDMLLVLVMILFFERLFALDLVRRRAHLILGGLLGLACALKYNGCFLAVPYLFLAGSAKLRFGRFLKGSVLCAAAAVTVFFALNPFVVLDWNFFLSELSEQNQANTGVPFLHHLIYSLSEGMSWPLVLAALAGLGLVFFAGDRKLQSGALFFTVYYVLLWQKGQPYGRYVLPLIPAAIFLALFTARFCWERFPQIRFVVVFILASGLGINLAKSVQFDLILSRPDIRTEAAAWIEENIPEGAKLALDGTALTPRLSFSCGQLAEKINSLASRQDGFESSARKRLEAKLQSCRRKRGYELRFLSRNPGQNPFLFAAPEIPWDESFWRNEGIEYWVIVPFLHSERDLKAIRQGRKLIRSWDPYRAENTDPRKLDGQIMTGGPLTGKDLFARRSNGYRIELYARS